MQLLLLKCTCSKCVHQFEFCLAVTFSKLVGKKANIQLLFLLMQLGHHHLKNGSYLSKGLCILYRSFFIVYWVIFHGFKHWGLGLFS